MIMTERPKCYGWMDVRSPGEPAPQLAPCGVAPGRSIGINEVVYSCHAHVGRLGTPEADR